MKILSRLNKITAGEAYTYQKSMPNSLEYLPDSLDFHPILTMGSKVDWEEGREIIARVSANSPASSKVGVFSYKGKTSEIKAKEIQKEFEAACKEFDKKIGSLFSKYGFTPYK